MTIIDKFSMDNDNVIVTQLDKKFVESNPKEIQINGSKYNVNYIRLHILNMVSIHVSQKLDNVNKNDEIKY